MKEYTRKNLNIKRLLAQGDLDIRAIAAGNIMLEADEYFSRVDQFVANAPQLVGELLVSCKTQTKAGDDTLGILESLRNILTAIGYNKLDADLESACNAVENGTFQSAVGMELSVKLNTLFERIKSAYITKRFGNTTSDSIADSSENSILLCEALEFFDYEEANRLLRILAVDDITPVLNTVTSILRPYYEVFALKNSSQVESFLKHTTPELFLLDIEMGQINGFDLIPIIRQFDEHKETPIIFLTGNATSSNLRDAVTLGACDFITKPIDRAVLLGKIEKCIVRKKAY